MKCGFHGSFDKYSNLILWMSFGLLFASLWLPTAIIRGIIGGYEGGDELLGYHIFFLSTILALSLPTNPFNLFSGEIGLLISTSNLSFLLVLLVPRKPKNTLNDPLLPSLVLFFALLPAMLLWPLFRSGVLVNLSYGYFLWNIALILNAFVAYHAYENKAALWRKTLVLTSIAAILVSINLYVAYFHPIH